VIAPFHPEVVVVGGGIARASGLFFPIARRVIEDTGIRLVPSTLFDQAQLIGAAAYWRDEHSGPNDEAETRSSRSGVPS
jgi:glucokinase